MLFRYITDIYRDDDQMKNKHSVRIMQPSLNAKCGGMSSNHWQLNG
jgi:hypothetical protein